MCERLRSSQNVNVITLCRTVVREVISRASVLMPVLQQRPGKLLIKSLARLYSGPRSSHIVHI
jgi:hypothetical protein